MVQSQLVPRGITDTRVLAAMSQVPREEFVPEFLQDDAYGDWPLPIGYGQTISQPYTVAFMVQALELTGNEKVLEIGTGSGYAAAVLSRVASTVETVERIDALGRQAKERLSKLGYDNVRVHIGDGSLGLEHAGPFDAIVVTAAAEHLPRAYSSQLAEGGRIVIPLGQWFDQRLYRFRLSDGELHAQNLGAFVFVPLIGEDS
jgi:protein-L-isoaspartate(D-aspartate) O-methyltransferase